MKFLCECGHAIYDQTDDLPYKAYSWPDQSREAAFAAIERIMKSPAPSDHLERDALIWPIVSPQGSRLMYQCSKCGRIYIQDDGTLHCFKPEFDNTPKTLFQASSSTGESDLT